MTKRTISDVYRRRKYKGALFGVEIEAEFSDPFEIPAFGFEKDWHVTGDDSLRNYGLELISQPSSVDKILTDIPCVYKQLAPLDYIISNRTSVHMHMNVTDLTSHEVLKILVLYNLLEYYFEKYIGEERVGNLFALGAEYSEDSVRRLIENIQNTQDIDDIFKVQCKYSSVNITSITQKGTVEFRSLPNRHDPDHVVGFIKALTLLREISLKFKDLEELLNVFGTFNTNQIWDWFGDLLQLLGVKSKEELDLNAFMRNYSLCWLLFDAYSTRLSQNLAYLNKVDNAGTNKYLFKTEEETDDLAWEELDTNF